MDKKPKNTEEKKHADKSKLIKILVLVLILLVIAIILLFLYKCTDILGARNDAGTNGPATVLEPDYPNIPDDTNAAVIENDESGEKPEVTEGGGSMSISFSDKVTYSISRKKLSLYYQNPGASTHNVVVQVILTRGADEYLLAQSGVIKPGYQLTGVDANDNVPTLSEGGYTGKLRLLFYDPDTGERAIVDTDIPCTITVTK